jgi:hypothetical protein
MGEPGTVNRRPWQRNDAIVRVLNAQVHARTFGQNQRLERPKYALIEDGIDVVNHAHIVIRILKDKQALLRVNGGRLRANLNLAWSFPTLDSRLLTLGSRQMPLPRHC